MLIAALVALALLPGDGRAVEKALCDAPVPNPVACENSKPGNPPSQWRIVGAGSASIQGFATQMSVNKGQTVSFKIKAPSPDFNIDIYRLGYYGGDGARKLADDVPHAATFAQPACPTSSATGMTDCGNWFVNGSWTVPGTAVSGVYIAHLSRTDAVGEVSHIVFVVRDDASTSDIVLSTSDADWQAYNDYQSGNSLYACAVNCPSGGGGPGRAFKVSYNRPFHTADVQSGRPWLFRAEYAMIRFLEANGYDLSYTSSVDLHSRGPLLKNHRLYISSGQDEYWSDTMRANVVAARDAGVNLAFFSGNEMFWKTRWEDANRTMVSYKETHADESIDPTAQWTGTWQDPRFSPPKDGGRAQNSVTGQVFSVNTGPGESSSAAMEVPAAFGQQRMWRDTAAEDGPLTLAPRTIGFEWDEDLDNGFRPPGLIRMSSTTRPSVEAITDYGSTYAPQPATHSLTMYRAPSGARVFGAGTVQWSWGLDSDQPQGNAPDPNMRQATVNLLADLDAQPDTLQAGLVAASKTTDATTPISTLNSPPANVSDGALMTLSGTASDAGGGVVAGVEVSTDGGTTWHRATGTTSWSYSWTAHGHPGVIRTRAIDDSANIEAAGPGTLVNVGCPCSLWGQSVTPAVTDNGESQDYELGVKFRSDSAGTISGVRFYRSAANVGPHVGRLWDAATGAKLAEATFSDSGPGWQSVAFAPAVAILANKTYVASYSTNGHYAATKGYFYTPPAPSARGGATVDSPPLHALRTAGVLANTENGVFAHVPGDFPDQSFNATNYWVDPVFAASAVGPVTGVSATVAGATSANVSWAAPAGGPTAYEIVPFIGAAAQPSRFVTSSPPGTSTTVTGLATGQTYTFKVRASNGAGAGALSAASNAVTPTAPPPPPPPIAPPPPPPAIVPPPPGTMLNTVGAALKSASIRRTKRGRRVLRIVTKLDETVKIAITLKRGSKTLVKRTRSKVFKGTRTIQINLPSKAPAGNARLRLVFTDSAGKKMTITRTRKVPARRKAI